MVTGKGYIPGASGRLEPIDIGDIEAYEDECYNGLDYDDYEKQCALRQEENDRYLDEFYEDLVAAGLKPKTIEKHIGNVEFYLNTFLLREAPLDVRAGCYKVGDFLGNFFIRKCMWSTPTSIKGNAASFKKFYKSMLERGHVSEEDVATLRVIIKEDLGYWCDLCEEYNTPGSANPFSPFADDFLSGLSGGEELVGDGEIGASIVQMLGEIWGDLRAEGYSEKEIVDMFLDAGEQLNRHVDLLEADEGELLGRLGDMGFTADRAKLEELIANSDAAEQVVDALCEAGGIELDDEGYDRACAILWHLNERWVSDDGVDGQVR